MLKIGITQRVETIAQYEETRDSLDQRWQDLARSINAIFVPIPNAIDNVETYFEALNLDGCILSGGNDHVMRKHCERVCLDYCIKRRLPVLGICHGMQYIAQYFGGSLQDVDGHVACPHRVIIQENPFNMPEGHITVNSYHRFKLPNAPADFNSFAIDKDGNCEGMYHKNLPIVAFMWHPERPVRLPWFNTFLKEFYHAP